MSEEKPLKYEKPVLVELSKPDLQCEGGNCSPGNGNATGQCRAGTNNTGGNCNGGSGVSG